MGRGLGWGHWASTGIAWGTELPLTGYGGEDLREHCWMSQRITAAKLCAGPFFAEVGHRCQAEVPAPRSHPAAPSLLPLCHTHAQAPLQPPNLGLTVDLNLVMLRGSHLALSGRWGGRKGLGGGQHSPESWQHHTLPAWSWQNQPLLLFCSPSSEHHAGKQSSQCWGGSPELMSSWNCEEAANCHCHTGTSGGSCCGWPVMGEGAQTGGKALC